MQINNQKKFQDLQPGDILLFKGNDIISKLIETVTKSKYSHAGIYFGSISNRKFIVHATASGVLLTPLDLIEATTVDIYRVREHQIKDEELQEKIIQSISVKYDFKGLFGIFFEEINFLNTNFLQDKNKFFCSELISSIFYPILGNDNSIISPEDIANCIQVKQIS